MTEELKALLARVRERPVTGAEREETRISFVYGNLALENPAITRESVRQVAATMPIPRVRGVE